MSHTIKDVKAAFRLFITTVQGNTAALQTLAAEQRELRTQLEALVVDSNFMVTAKKKEIQRSGHKVA